MAEVLYAFDHGSFVYGTHTTDIFYNMKDASSEDYKAKYKPVE